MNKSKLKTYAPQARKDFIAAVTARANLLGLSEAGGKLEVAPGERKGDLAIIAGREWPTKVYEQRERLIKHIQTAGFAQTMEAVAYTWFNRFAALRYMEIHDYLDHGQRVLSNRSGGMPEILNHATELELPGYNKAKAVELKLAGNKDGELYKMLLVAQCNALSRAMPFLFERIDDETELLLPDNLLRTDSIIAKLVEAIPEEDWQEVEIIGWLYQFYISEKKDEVIGKVVKSEDIPAATQLFTPNWIVQYLVQNSVGRLWLMANPASTLKSQWPYYIEPAEQTPEVQAQLDTLIQTRMNEDGGSLNPETITVLDPACGSGHILVVAYDVLKTIYLERGYQLRVIPRLILEKNLYGLDIDDRAAQLAGFALLMKARADDRRLFDNPPKLNVLALQESKGLDADEIIKALNTVRAEPVEAQSIRQLIDTFAHAKTFGSLIQIPPELNTQLATLAEGLQQAIQHGDLYAKAAAQDLLPLVQQARVLGMQFDAVVANPPYLGGKGLNAELKDFLRDFYNDVKSDLFAAFTVRCSALGSPNARIGIMSPNVWMYISSHEKLRTFISLRRTLESLVELPLSGFKGATVQICSYIFSNAHITNAKGSFIRLVDLKGGDAEMATYTQQAIQNRNCGYFFDAAQDEFKKIPGSPVAYWVSTSFRQVFEEGTSLGMLVDSAVGLQTSDNDRFLRRWYEVCFACIGFGANSRSDSRVSKRKWFPYNKGGDFRRWYGNQEYIVNWKDDGSELFAFATKLYKSPTRIIKNTVYYFLPSMSWSDVTSGPPSFRVFPNGFIHDAKGMSAFHPRVLSCEALLGYCNTPIITYAAKALNPTLSFQAGNFDSLPIVVARVESIAAAIAKLATNLVTLSSRDWDAYETSWGFQTLPILTASTDLKSSLETNYTTWVTQNRETISETKRLEEENNRLCIDAYGLANELTADVPTEQITLTVNPAYRYGGKLTEEDQWIRFRQDTMGELISYAIGCMMGRYSLDEPGLIYAHAGNVGFDATRYPTFPTDADGIVPLTDDLWFEDDAANRIREFLLAVWGAETLEENLTWLAESLGKKGNETPEETIRRYLSGSFFKDHLQTYKKRPIYWLFSSGKQGAFQALVYLHRYHEGTLARMRSEYVVPLTGKIQSRIEMLTKDAEAATSTAARNKLNKEIESLRKKHVELLSYDEKLRHYADTRIKLDLDDGVKVNYGKFGDLLSDVKSVTGGSSDD